MRTAVKTPLPPIDAPLEWATLSNGTFYTAVIGTLADGTMDTGDIRSQTRYSLDNLKLCIEAAGGTMDDVAQVLVYLTNRQDAAGMNEVYSQYFRKPYPNRATVVISELLVPGCIVEMVAYGHIASPKS